MSPVPGLDQQMRFSRRSRLSLGDSCLHRLTGFRGCRIAPTTKKTRRYESVPLLLFTLTCFQFYIYCLCLGGHPNRCHLVLIFFVRLTFDFRLVFIWAVCPHLVMVFCLHCQVGCLARGASVLLNSIFFFTYSVWQCGHVIFMISCYKCTLST